MQANSIIDVQDFHKAYDNTVAVRGLTFRVEPGQILGLIGPNGAGKTTTLRTLSGIIPASRGSIAIAGHPLASQPIAAKRKLAYIPDEPQLFTDLTVDEHLEFAALAYQVVDPAPKIASLLEHFELTSKRHSFVSDLSRGMKQKLAVCAGYLHEPLAIFLDEPLTGLDPLGIRRLKESLRQRAHAGAAVIVSSHLLAMVEDLCTHVLILSNGEQRFCGKISEVCDHFSSSAEVTTLEEVFFLATSNTPTAPVCVS